MPPAVQPRVLTRRQGLMALALAGPVAALAACTSADQAPEQAADATAATPGADTVSHAAADEAALVARYEAALEAIPDDETELRAALAAIRDQHRDHVSALGGAEDASAPAITATGSAAVLADLIAAERTAAKERISACVDAREPEPARVLALIAASEASHVPALRDLRALARGGAA